MIIFYNSHDFSCIVSWFSRVRDLESSLMSQFQHPRALFQVSHIQQQQMTSVLERLSSRKSSVKGRS